MMEDLEERVIKVIQEDASGDYTVTKETHFLHDLGYDSIDPFELIYALEEKLDIRIPLEDINKVVKKILHGNYFVSDLIKWLEPYIIEKEEREKTTYKYSLFEYH